MRACLYFLERYRNSIQLLCLAPNQILTKIVSEFLICDYCTIRTDLTILLFILELSPMRLLKIGLRLSFLSKLMVTHLNDRMMYTRNGRGDPEPTMSNGTPPPPPTLAQAIAFILESRDEQTKLRWQLVANSTPACGGNRARKTPLKLQPHMGTLQLLICRSSLRQESH
jgi:hypothetical protein